MTDSSTGLPERIYDAAGAAALDQRFIGELGVASFELMQRAANAAYVELASIWPVPGSLCVVCGPGNNGGDGFLVAALAREHGWSVRLIGLVEETRYRGDAARALAAYRVAGGSVEAFDDRPIEADVVVDAVFGTGLDRDVEGRFAQAIARINEAADRGAGVLAIDIASGIDATTGRVWSQAVRAQATVTFISIKLGQLTGHGPGSCGDLRFRSLDAPDALFSDRPSVATRLNERRLRAALAPRARTLHKGDNGHVLCVGGNRGLGGAIRMTAEAALRSGAGLVSVVCHGDHAGAMSQARPELMCLAVEADTDIKSWIEAADVIAVGPGLGGDAWADNLWRQVRNSDKALVVDADALNALSRAPAARGNWIITPHPGEAARLLGCTAAAVVDDRVETVRALARDHRAVAVLKGAGTLIAAGDELNVCSDGNPGMAVGGMGDLLTGVIAALVAQGHSLAEAARLGVYVHARAGDRAAGTGGERGLLPSDLFGHLREIVNPGSG